MPTLHTEQPGARPGQTDSSAFLTPGGRFSIENTWTIARNREPNWLLVDTESGKQYRFFVLSELYTKIYELLNGD